MKHLGGALLGAFLVLVSLLAGIPSQSAPSPPATVQMVVEWRPGNVVTQTCVVQAHIAYTNKTGQNQHLQAVDLWMGVKRGAFADLVLEVYRMTPATGAKLFVASIRQDRYRDPAEDHQRYISFAPAVIVIAPGDFIQVNALNCYAAGETSKMHPAGDFYFVEWQP